MNQRFVIACLLALSILATVLVCKSFDRMRETIHFVRVR